MNSHESYAYTVIKKQEIKNFIKTIASNLLVTINKTGNKKNFKSEFQRFNKIKQLIGQFRDAR